MFHQVIPKKGKLVNFHPHSVALDFNPNDPTDKVKPVRCELPYKILDDEKTYGRNKHPKRLDEATQRRKEFLDYNSDDHSYTPVEFLSLPPIKEQTEKILLGKPRREYPTNGTA